MDKLTIDEALGYSSGNYLYQKRQVLLFALGQTAITFVIMGIPLMFPEFDKECLEENCYVPERFTKTASAELEVYGESKWKIAYIGTCYFAGMMIFALLISWLSDNKGRKTVIFYSSILSSVIILSLALANHFYVFLVAYFLFGGAELGVYCSGFILLTESVDPFKRNIFSGFALCSWGIGSIILMVLFMLGIYWRHILFIAFIMMFFYFLMLRFVHESPRWLYQNSAVPEDSLKILNSISITNGVGSFEYDLKKDSNYTGKSYSYAVFIQNKEVFHTVSLCIVIWFNIILVYYTMIFMMAQFISDVYLEGLVMAIGETVATGLVSYYVNVIGRKTAAIWSFLICAAAFVLISIVQMTGQGGVQEITVLVISFLARAAVSGEFNFFYIYIAELFPTSIRNMAFGLCNNVGRIGGVLAAHVPAICSAVGVSPFMVLASAMVLSAFLSYYLEETLNRDMKDSVKDPSKDSQRFSI